MASSKKWEEKAFAHKSSLKNTTEQRYITSGWVTPISGVNTSGMHNNVLTSFETKIYTVPDTSSKIALVRRGNRSERKTKKRMPSKWFTLNNFGASRTAFAVICDV